jgi:hypothetical protein
MRSEDEEEMGKGTGKSIRLTEITPVANEIMQLSEDWTNFGGCNVDRIQNIDIMKYAVMRGL